LIAFRKITGKTGRFGAQAGIRIKELTLKIFIAPELWQAVAFITNLSGKSKWRSVEKGIENFGIVRN